MAQVSTPTIPLQVVKAVCPHDCPDTCGMVVTVQEDRAIDLRGDKSHPFTRGFLCQKVNHYLDRVYHKNRLQHPLRRVGKKGSGRFTRITWDEAIAEITTQLSNIANSQYGPQAILPYSYAGTMGKLQYASIDRRFFHRLGASMLDRTICATAGAAGCDVTLGTRATIDPEAIVQARYIINWGSNTAVTNIHLWSLMHKARKTGAKIVTIDPRRSDTAKKSDWWIPIRPGTDAALAMGLMHIIVRDQLQDQDYLDRYTIGFKQLSDRLKEFPPHVVAAITSLPESTIEHLARELGLASQIYGGPSLVRLNYGLQRHGGGAMAVRTICCLPAVTGSWRFPGGGALLSTSKLSPWNGAGLERPDLIPANTRTINMVQLAEALHGELPGPPVKALFVYNSNPAAVNPQQQKVLQGLEREDLFTVVHDLFQTDTADYADIVLPATSQLEHWDIHSAYGHLYIQLNRPAIPPLAEAKPNTEVFRLLAKAFKFEPEIYQETDEELIQLALQPKAGYGGYPSASAFDGITWERLLTGEPIRINLPASFVPFAEGNFPTPSGKCELYSQREADAGRDPLPNYTPPHEDPQTKPDLAAKYPFQFICPPENSFLNSSFANIESLQPVHREPIVEVNPQDAEAYHLHKDDLVRIFNDRGAFQAKVVISDNVPQGVLASYGVYWSRLIGGANCNSVTSTATTDLGGGATFFDNLVQIEKYSLTEN
ncbi:MAG: molybdopterin-dependent oxidoreductase [Zavarzinella sp.]